MNKYWKFNVDILILSKVLGSEMKCFGFGIQKMIQKITKDCKRFRKIDSDRFIFNQQAAQNAANAAVAQAAQNAAAAQSIANKVRFFIICKLQRKSMRHIVT